MQGLRSTIMTLDERPKTDSYGRLVVIATMRRARRSNGARCASNAVPSPSHQGSICPQATTMSPSPLDGAMDGSTGPSTMTYCE